MPDARKGTTRVEPKMISFNSADGRSRREGQKLITQTRRTRDDGGGSDPERRKRRDEGCEALMIQKRREWVDADSLRKMMRVVMPLHEEEEEVEQKSEKEGMKSCLWP